MSADPSDAYRPCVGVMVLNQDAHVLVGQRIDSQSEAWQMPQGGIDDGETAHQAMRRELREEIGTDQVDSLAHHTDWLYYDLPADLAPSLWGGKYRGQKQQWFAVYLQDTSLVNIHTDHAEFSSTQWVEPASLPELIVPFKRDLYTRILHIFTPVIASFMQARSTQK